MRKKERATKRKIGKHFEVTEHVKANLEDVYEDINV